MAGLINDGIPVLTFNSDSPPTFSKEENRVNPSEANSVNAATNNNYDTPNSYTPICFSLPWEEVGDGCLMVGVTPSTQTTFPNYFFILPKIYFFIPIINFKTDTFVLCKTIELQFKRFVK